MKELPDLTIYPNPASNKIRLRGAPVGHFYAIIGENGSILKRGIIGMFEQQVDISGLPRGIYWVSLTNGRSASFMKK
ncbi:MAG: T9SS type A sorting domain-containing protein [Flavobacteriales bacterium]|nr:T9SS type A sorting domain-containing protein [Flavobacteriales bacterium]